MAQDIEALAHEVAWLKNNFKQYVAGNTYNGLALTVTGLNITVTRAIFKHIIAVGGDCKLGIRATGTVSGGPTTLNISISGIISKNIIGYYQNINCTTELGPTTCYINPNTSYLIISATAPFSVWEISDEIELNLKAIWADVV